MANISDIIEEFIKTLMGESNSVNISRNELAQYFDCAPSQINYVLMTRFSFDRGFVIESRRGGGGFISLLKVSPNRKELLKQLNEYTLTEGITFQKAVQIINRLIDEDLIDEKESDIIKAAISDKALLVPNINKEILRTNIMREVIKCLFKEEK